MMRATVPGQMRYEKKGSARGRRMLSVTLGALALALAGAAAPDARTPEAQPPATPREFFNAGTQKLRQGKLREAEALLQSALATQTDRLQSPALYNLGHVRFIQGLEELKKGPAAQPSLQRGAAASGSALDAIRSADTALAGTDVQQLVASYLRGRGARRELKAATRAVRSALETYGATLSKWRRSSGDFHSAGELTPSDKAARQNADTVDRAIAKLVDSLQQLQSMSSSMGQNDKDLREKLKQLKGRIPAPDMPPGAAGDDEDDEEQKQGPQPGQQEAPAKQGEEMLLTPEQASWLLEGFRLDNERRLPMGQEETGKPVDRTGRDW